MDIIDFTKKFNTPQNTSGKHAVIFPKNIFCIIAGSTGCGKTNLMLNLLKKEKMLNYNQVYVYSSTLHQPACEYLREFYENLENIIKCKIAYFFDADTEILNPSDLDKNKNHIMLFDDVC